MVKTRIKSLNSGGVKSGKMSTRIDKYEPEQLKGDSPLLEIVVMVILLTAYILWKNYPK